jgi:hypothetical protein
VSAPSTTTHAAVPAHAPDQPANAWPAFGVAVSVIDVPAVNEAEQVPGHEIPVGEDVTLPPPLIKTESANVVGGGVTVANVAVTAAAASSVKTHDDVPLHAPDQPVNVWPLFGVAVSVIEVPALNEAEQVPGHEMPAGDEVTLPLPLTETERTNVVGGGGVVTVASIAPMSQCGPTGRVVPTRSLPGQLSSSPPSIAGLPGCGTSPTSSGSVLCMSPACVKEVQLASEERLWPADELEPLQFAGVFWSKSVLKRSTRPPCSSKPPPPEPALLP